MFSILPIIWNFYYHSLHLLFLLLLTLLHLGPDIINPQRMQLFSNLPSSVLADKFFKHFFLGPKCVIMLWQKQHSCSFLVSTFLARSEPFEVNDPISFSCCTLEHIFFKPRCAKNVFSSNVIFYYQSCCILHLWSHWYNINSAQKVCWTSVKTRSGLSYQTLTTHLSYIASHCDPAHDL